MFLVPCSLTWSQQLLVSEGQASFIIQMFQVNLNIFAHLVPFYEHPHAFTGCLIS